jgi:hypothetical protein
MIATGGIPIVYPQSRQARIELALWLSNKGALTPAVEQTFIRFQVTLGISLITRNSQVHDWN